MFDSDMGYCRNAFGGLSTVSGQVSAASLNIQACSEYRNQFQPSHFGGFPLWKERHRPAERDPKTPLGSPSAVISGVMLTCSV